MKKENDPQNPQQRTGSAENTGNSRDQQNNLGREAGLGRDRMSEIEDLKGLNGGDDYAGSDKDDLGNQNLNASNDQ